MRKLFLIMFLVLAALSACTPQKLSFGEVDKVPNKVTEVIDPDDQLQVINRSGKIYYIVFHSHKEVEANLETVDTTALIKLDEIDSQNDEIKQYIYFLTTDQYHDTIDIKVNGESKSYPVTIID